MHRTSYFAHKISTARLQVSPHGALCWRSRSEGALSASDSATTLVRGKITVNLGTPGYCTALDHGSGKITRTASVIEPHPYICTCDLNAVQYMQHICQQCSCASQQRVSASAGVICRGLSADDAEHFCSSRCWCHLLHCAASYLPVRGSFNAGDFHRLRGADIFFCHVGRPASTRDSQI